MFGAKSAPVLHHGAAMSVRTTPGRWMPMPFTATRVPAEIE